MAGKENASEHHWVNEYSSIELNAVWTHFLATFKYLELRALLALFHAKTNVDITVKSKKLISWLGLCNSRSQQLTARNSDWRGHCTHQKVPPHHCHRQQEFHPPQCLLWTEELCFTPHFLSTQQLRPILALICNPVTGYTKHWTPAYAPASATAEHQNGNSWAILMRALFYCMGLFA